MDYEKVCKTCATEFSTRFRKRQFCDRKCQNKHFNSKGKRLSLLLTDEQREHILSLEREYIQFNAASGSF